MLDPMFFRCRVQRCSFAPVPWIFISHGQRFNARVRDSSHKKVDQVSGLVFTIGGENVKSGLAAECPTVGDGECAFEVLGSLLPHGLTQILLECFAEKVQMKNIPQKYLTLILQQLLRGKHNVS